MLVGGVEDKPEGRTVIDSAKAFAKLVSQHDDGEKPLIIFDFDQVLDSMRTLVEDLITQYLQITMTDDEIAAEINAIKLLDRYKETFRPRPGSTMTAKDYALQKAASVTAMHIAGAVERRLVDSTKQQLPQVCRLLRGVWNDNERTVVLTARCGTSARVVHGFLNSKGFNMSSNPFKFELTQTMPRLPHHAEQVSDHVITATRNRKSAVTLQLILQNAQLLAQAQSEKGLTLYFIDDSHKNIADMRQLNTLASSHGLQVTVIAHQHAVEKSAVAILASASITADTLLADIRDLLLSEEPVHRHPHDDDKADNAIVEAVRRICLKRGRVNGLLSFIQDKVTTHAPRPSAVTPNVNMTLFGSGGAIGAAVQNSHPGAGAAGLECSTAVLHPRRPQA